ncbi:MAG: protoporphyrinogen oxidase, partial [Acidobacteria bacterium]
FWSLRGGLEELIAALEAQLGATSILRGRAARRLRARREPARFELELDGGRMVEADAVILATPAAVASALTRELAPALAADLAALRAASVAVISLAYRLADAPPTPGFGFFVPRREGRTILAGTWMSTKFDHRAPPDHVLLRVFAGGAHDPQAVELPDGELLARAAADLRQLCGIDAAPVTSAVERWREGYPQYDVGHPQRIRRIESKLPPGLFLAGSPYHGVGLPDCAASGRRAAVAAVAHLATLPPPVMAGAGSLG